MSELPGTVQLADGHYTRAGAAMKARYVKELAEGSRVETVFLLRAKEVRAARTGEAYLAVELADKTGAIGGVHFRPSRMAADVPAGSVVDIVGMVTSFRGVRRISIERMRPASRWDAADLIASSPRSVEEMTEEFKSLVRSVQDPGLRGLLRELFGDSELFARFSRCPGSQSYHHAYLGGLMEHTIAVASNCARVACTYPSANRDVLVTAALVHDIGKIDELSYDTGVEYTDEGRLMGHVVLGVRRLHELAATAALSPEIRRLVEHAVLSHHGELEWGSPKRPSTVEALLLHHVDNLDAKVAGFSQAVAGATMAEEVWTDAENLFRRPLYAPRPAEGERSRRCEEDGRDFRMTA